VRVSVADAARLQTDYGSIAARRLVARLAGIDGRDPREERALDLLRSWDGRVEASSPAAALFEVWKTKHLPPAYWSGVARAEGFGAEAGETLAAGATIGALFAALERGALAPEPARAAFLDSLGAAAAELEGALGADWSGWSWGALHHSRLEHPLSALLRERQGIEADVGPLPRGGSGETPGATTYRPSDFRQVSGASVRVAIDVGAWDESLAMNTPGQSGVPGSPHYQDLFPAWAADQSFPFLWSRERIEAETVRRIRLVP
jgi:penicillin amidase